MAPETSTVPSVLSLSGTSVLSTGPLIPHRDNLGSEECEMCGIISVRIAGRRPEPRVTLSFLNYICFLGLYEVQTGLLLALCSSLAFNLKLS